MAAVHLERRVEINQPKTMESRPRFWGRALPCPQANIQSKACATIVGAQITHLVSYSARSTNRIPRKVRNSGFQKRRYRRLIMFESEVMDRSRCLSPLVVKPNFRKATCLRRLRSRDRLHLCGRSFAVGQSGKTSDVFMLATRSTVPQSNKSREGKYHLRIRPICMMLILVGVTRWIQRRAANNS